MDTTRHDSFCPICFCPIWRQPSFFVSSPVGVEGHWTVHSLVWMAHALPRCSRLPAASEPTTLCIYRVQRQAREGAMPRLLAGHRSLSVSASLCFASGNLAVPIWPRLATANLHLLTLGSLSTISHASPSIPAPPDKQTKKWQSRPSPAPRAAARLARPRTAMKSLASSTTSRSSRRLARRGCAGPWRCSPRPTSCALAGSCMP